LETDPQGRRPKEKNDMEREVQERVASLKPRRLEHEISQARGNCKKRGTLCIRSTYGKSTKMELFWGSEGWGEEGPRAKKG